MFRTIPGLILLLSATQAAATPAEVILIRHAEKITDANPHLSARGKKRADALAEYFLKPETQKELGKIDAIYAASPKHARNSLRSVETVQPLAKKAGLKLVEKFHAKDTDELADEILESKALEGKTVLISWPHEQLRELASALGVKWKKTYRWKGSRYDRIWKISFKNGKAKLEDLPQHLLPGDSD